MDNTIIHICIFREFLKRHGYSTKDVLFFSYGDDNMFITRKGVIIKDEDVIQWYKKHNLVIRYIRKGDFMKIDFLSKNFRFLSDVWRNKYEEIGHEMIVHYRDEMVNFTRLLMPDDFAVDNTMITGR